MKLIHAILGSTAFTVIVTLIATYVFLSVGGACR